MKSSVQATLGQIVLGFELIVVGLASLTIFGLKALPAEIALGGGAAVCLAMVITIILMRKYSWSFVLGWMIQFVVVLSGFLVTTMFVVGILFTAVWAYAMTQGKKLDSQKKDYS